MNILNTANTKTIVDNNIHHLQKSCQKRTDDPQLLTICYTELLKIHRIQHINNVDIPKFIDSIVNVNFYYKSSQYNKFNDLICDNKHFYNLGASNNEVEPIELISGEYYKEGSDKVFNYKVDNEQLNLINNNEIDHAKLHRIIARAFNESDLPTRLDKWYYHKLFTKYYVEGYTYKQIEEQTDEKDVKIAKKTVYNGVRKGLRIFKEHIINEYGTFDGFFEHIKNDG